MNLFITRGLSLLAAMLVTNVGIVAAEASGEDCEAWAASGECSLNPKYMLANCVEACEQQAALNMALAQEIEQKIGHINSFFQLDAFDIDKKIVKFDQYRGQVTLITNVASYCGYTESHYKGLVELYHRFKDSTPVGFNILAFPCNQFGEQEPDACPAINRFVKIKGVEFTMMDKIDVNGITANPVYHYLKKVAGPPAIKWNFATYYIVSPTGVIQSFSGVEPLELIPAVLKAMSRGDEL